MEVLKCWDLTWLAPCPTPNNFTNNGWMGWNKFFFLTQHCLKKRGGGGWRMKYHCQYFAQLFQIQSTLRENSASRISLLLFHLIQYVKCWHTSKSCTSRGIEVNNAFALLKVIAFLLFLLLLLLPSLKLPFLYCM